MEQEIELKSQTSTLTTRPSLNFLPFAGLDPSVTVIGANHKHLGYWIRVAGIIIRQNVNSLLYNYYRKLDSKIIFCYSEISSFSFLFIDSIYIMYFE